MEDLLKVGVIASTHGIKGEVKVFPTTDDMNRFKELKECIMITKKGSQTLHPESCKFFKNMVILKFKEFNNINEVEEYKQGELFVTRENAVKLKNDEYFITDIIDALVVNEEGNEIGVLGEVLLTGANDVYVIKTKDGKEVLVPAIKQCIIDINVKEHKIIVRLMEGMMD